MRGYFLVDAPHLLNFVNFDEGFFNRKSSYDLGVFLQTNRLPFDVSLSYAQRGISGTDNFKNKDAGVLGQNDTVQVETLDYNLNPQGASLSLSHWFSHDPNDPHSPDATRTGAAPDGWERGESRLARSKRERPIGPDPRPSTG